MPKIGLNSLIYQPDFVGEAPGSSVQKSHVAVQKIVIILMGKAVIFNK